MSELIAKAGITRQKGFLYYLGKDGNVWCFKRGTKGAKKVADTEVKREAGFLYFIDSSGNVCRAKMTRRTKKK